MKNKIWTMPLLLLLSGIASRVCTFTTIRMFLIKTQDADGVWNASLPLWYNLFSAALNLAILIGVGLLLRRLCDRGMILVSAWIMVLYGFLVLGLEQLAQKLALPLHPLIWYLYLPGETFSSMGSHILQMLPIDGWIWPWAILSQFFPLLFIPCGKRSLSQTDTAE